MPFLYGEMFYPGGIKKGGAPSITGDTAYNRTKYTMGKDKYNPRFHNGNRRRKYRERFKAMNAPCGICKGRLGAIRYDEPSDAQHPLSFVIDEIKPVSRYKEFGYDSREAACDDWNNLQAAHYCCNLAKSNRVTTDRKVVNMGNKIISDGVW